MKLYHNAERLYACILLALCPGCQTWGTLYHKRSDRRVEARRCSGCWRQEGAEEV